MDCRDPQELYPSYKKDFTRGPLTRGPRASSCYRMIIEHLRIPRLPVFKAMKISYGIRCFTACKAQRQAVSLNLNTAHLPQRQRAGACVLMDSGLVNRGKQTDDAGRSPIRELIPTIQPITEGLELPDKDLRSVRQIPRLFPSQSRSC